MRPSPRRRARVRSLAERVRLAPPFLLHNQPNRIHLRINRVRRRVRGSGCPVRQEARPDPAAEDEALDSTIASRVPSGVLVQVAAVTNRQDAANVVGVLKSKNYPALVLSPAQAKAKDSFYRVVAGPYKSRTQAERVRKELTAEGFKPFIR